MRQGIYGFTDGEIEQAAAAGTLPQLAAELVAVRDLLAGSEDLSRVLSDPGVRVPARRNVVVDLLGDRLLPATMLLLTYAIEHDRATAIVEDVSWLATHVGALAEGRRVVGEAVLGRHAAAERIEGYATAVLDQVARDGRLGDVEDELFRFMRVADGSEELRAALTDRDLPAEARGGLVRDLLGARATPATTALAAYATRVGRPRDYFDHLAALVEQVAGESDRRVADVHTPVELTDGERNRLAAALTRALGRTVEIRVTIDPGVLGGFVATVGDTVVDGSVRHRLDLLKDRLVLPEATITTTGEAS